MKFDLREAAVAVISVLLFATVILSGATLWLLINSNLPV
jgi:hypothetical protein